MAYHNNEPLNNRSGLGEKEKMERQAAKRATERQEELDAAREEKQSFPDNVGK